MQNVMVTIQFHWLWHGELIFVMEKKHIYKIVIVIHANENEK